MGQPTRRIGEEPPKIQVWKDNMQVSIDRRQGQAAVITPEGRLDLASASEFKQILTDAVEAGDRILVVDLSNVPFVDSSGLGALISGMKATRIAGGDLRIAEVGDQARLILELTSLDKVMKIYPTVEEALVDN